MLLSSSASAETTLPSLDHGSRTMTGTGGSMKILLVEDNERVAQFVRKGLTESGPYGGLCRQWARRPFSRRQRTLRRDHPRPHAARRGGRARHHRGLASDRNRTPILILSALAEVDERIRGLRAGGDDYLTKPFAFGELAARLDALVRRSQPVARLVLVGDLGWICSRAGDPRRPPDPAAAARIQAAGIPDAPCRAGGHAHHAARECLGLSFRSPDQCHRRACQQAPAEDRRGFRATAAADGARQRLHADRPTTFD